MAVETWDFWYPEAASRGLSFALAAMEEARAVWLHSAPPNLRIEVRDESGKRVAFADQLQRQGEQFPMTRLDRQADGSFSREDRWPTQEDVGMIVILPGGEVGVLTAWWNAEDGSAWRWSVEFSNHR